LTPHLEGAAGASLISTEFTGSETIRPVNSRPPARSPARPAPLPLRAWRYARLGLHLAEGALTAALVFGLSSPARRRALRQGWSARLLAILGIRLEVQGEAITPGCMLVANHISWVDIFVINAVSPAAFVSKADVREWPLIGWLAARNETVFLRRGSRGHAKIINAEIAAILDARQNVAIFPEGTTTDGSHVLHFHAALLQPAIESGHPIQPAAISYHTPDGRRSLAPAYEGDVSLGQSMSSIIAEQGLFARLHIGVPLKTRDVHRRELAAAARQTITENLS
jgi:1-acyl-sn-glycerol-3-phosphate acyltransferase